MAQVSSRARRYRFSTFSSERAMTSSRPSVDQIVLLPVDHHATVSHHLPALRHWILMTPSTNTHPCTLRPAHQSAWSTRSNAGDNDHHLRARTPTREFLALWRRLRRLKSNLLVVTSPELVTKSQGPLHLAALYLEHQRPALHHPNRLVYGGRTTHSPIPFRKCKRKYETPIT